jgi:hypothetical protein
MKPAQSLEFIAIVHPSAQIGRDAKVGAGARIIFQEVALLFPVIDHPPVILKYIFL